MTRGTYLRGHRMSARETEIMNRWDVGMAREVIAAELGLALSTVVSVTAQYSGNGDPQREKAIRAASRQLGMAVAAYHLRRVQQGGAV